MKDSKKAKAARLAERVGSGEKPEQVAESLGVSRATAYRWLLDPETAAIRKAACESLVASIREASEAERQIVHRAQLARSVARGVAEGEAIIARIQAGCYGSMRRRRRKTR